MFDDPEDILDSFLDRVDDEGLEYTIIHYSDWTELKDVDPALWLLVRSFRSAYTDLDQYLFKQYRRR